MDKNKIQIAITAVLVVVLILVSINSCHRIKRKLSSVSVPAAAPAAVLAPQQRGGTISAVSKEQPQAKYAEAAKLEWIRDPFSDKIYLSGIGEIDLKLSGILWDEKSPSAIISNKIVTEADSIGKYTVLKIKEDRVILNDGVKNVELIIGK